jgi:hypothetical protein
MRTANHRGKYLQLQFTVEDKGVFTTPWTATMTYGSGGNDPTTGWNRLAQKTSCGTRERRPMYRGRITRIFEAPEDFSLRAVSARGAAANTGATPFLWNRAPR